jgi:predicted DCC family thiol-disulfide oxidoreductase YuxK
MNSSDSKSSPIVLYDGVCGLCEASVHFIIDHDPAGRIRFAALQSEIGRKLLAEHRMDPDALNTLVLIEEGQAYVRSTGALRICLLLGHGWSLLAETFLLIPEPVRDAVYGWVARNRYRWFGKRDACRLPTTNTDLI